MPPMEDNTTNTGTTYHHNHLSLSLLVLHRSFSTFLLRFHAGYFRISLSLASQSLLFKTLIHPATTIYHHPLSQIFHHHLHRTAVLPVLWSLSIFLHVLLSSLYLLKSLLHFPLVKAEFLHPVGVNYLFVPWISSLLLLQSSPFLSPMATAYLALWCLSAIPLVALDIKIYGQWFTTKGKRRFLTAVANPTSQITVIGNLVGSAAAARMGWLEAAVGLFSLGMVHYLVLLVTLYQRLKGSDKLPAMLRPVFFLFFAVPSMASLAWDSIAGKFDTGSKMLFFLSLFLFISLVCRPTLFKKSMRKFNVTWWAYSFPITVLAIASTKYAKEVKGRMADAIMLILSSLSSLVTLALLVLTLFNTRMLVPDDDPIPNFSDYQLPITTTKMSRLGESRRMVASIPRASVNPIDCNVISLNN